MRLVIKFLPRPLPRFFVFVHVYMFIQDYGLSSLKRTKKKTLRRRLTLFCLLSGTDFILGEETLSSVSLSIQPLPKYIAEWENI